MAVLQLFEITHHKNLVNELIDKLADNNITSCSFNISNGDLYNHNDIGLYLRLLIGLYSALMRVFKRGKFIIIKTIGKLILKEFRKNYDIVDIHYFSITYHYLIPFLKSCGYKIKVTYWGSDLYRASEDELKKQNNSLRHVDLIQGETVSVVEKIQVTFPEHASKCCTGHFGLIQFDRLGDIITHKQNLRVDFFKRNKDKLLIVCGYNGSPGQQHKIMIDALSALSDHLKNKIQLLFPMTYGLPSGEYLQIIKDNLDKSQIEYDILTQRLSIENVMVLRAVGDIVINIQITDSWSASLQEGIFCNTPLIVGDWLPYQQLDNLGIYYIKTNIDNLKYTIEKSITNYDGILMSCAANSDKIYRFSAWKYAIDDWIKNYHKISNLV